MKWISRILSAIAFMASFFTALYLGYKLFRPSDEEEGYLFGDAMYDPQDQQDLYQPPMDEEVEADISTAPLEDAEPSSPMIH